MDALTGARNSATALARTIERGERLGIPSLVLYEWLRGPRREAELRAQEQLLPAAEAFPFGATEAQVASRLYRSAARARHRELDIAIAAVALAQNCALWTLNVDDFEDIPGLRLFQSSRVPE